MYDGKKSVALRAFYDALSTAYVFSLDEYMPLDQAVCAAMNGLPVMQIAGTEIIGVEPALGDAIGLAIVDVVNAGDWLIIVAILEIEVARISWPLCTCPQAHVARGRVEMS